MFAFTRGQLQRARLVRGVADFNAMREAFNTTPKKTSATSSAAKPVQNTPVPSASGIDPAINIASRATPEVATKDSTGTIAETFGTSMNDFSPLEQTGASLDWSESFHGLGGAPFSAKSQKILADAIADDDIEITPDGLLYLPEIKYRRILNKAFGPGAWGMAPRSETQISKNRGGAGGLLTREYGLVIQGRLVSIARGEQQFFSDKGIPTATEGCKSNALMRCCKDLGIASELWDPRFIKKFKKKNCENLFVEHVPTKKKKKIWKRKDEDVEYPFKK